MKFVSFLIGLVCWLWLFLVPFGVLSLIGILLYHASGQNLPYFILLTVAGVVLGIVFAEHIRKKHGLVHFFSRLIATPELDRKEGSEEKKGN